MSKENPSPALRPSSIAKRDAILDAARKRFFADGFGMASIEAIAEDARVSKVTLYKHFGDKETLFKAAVERECEQIRSHFSIDGSQDDPVRTRLLDIGKAMVAFLSRPEMVQFERRIAAETQLEPGIGKTFLAAGPHRMKAAFTVFLRSLVDAGELQIEDLDLAAEQFVSMCKGMGDLERRFGMPADPVRDRKRIEGAVDVFCHAYGT